MTHSLHREGGRDSLERDYCLFIYPARGFNYVGSGPRVRGLMEIVFGQGPANLIVTTLRQHNLYSTATPEDMLGSVKDGARVYCTFDDREKIKNILARMKEAGLGISIVVSGLIDRVRDMAAEVGLDPHTINMSLGIQGKTELLAPADIRQYTTMCGHGMVSPNLVRDCLRKVKTGRAAAWEVSLTLAKPCACGIYNPFRSVELLNDMAPVYTVTRW